MPCYLLPDGLQIEESEMAKVKQKLGPSYRAIHRNVRMSPRKVKCIVDMIRGKNVDQARV